MARVVAAVLLVAVMCAAAPIGAAASTAAPTRWIVQLEPGTQLNDVIAPARARWGIVPSQRFNSVLHGFAATMTTTQRDALAADSRVVAIVPDVPVQAAGEPYPETADEVQPGVRRVGALNNSDRPEAMLDVDIAVLDTGIQPDNAELNIAGGYNCTDPAQDEAQRADPASWADSEFFGHGTHVSGIAAAIENGRGVAGVAQGARLWAIKVLNGGGSGFWSWVICGLDHVAQMRDPIDPSIPLIEVANMSIASSGWDDGDCGRSNTDLLHQAVCRLSEAGVTMVAAAGNSASDAANYVPAAYDEVITVSAMADWDGQAAGSGSPPIDCTRTESDDAFARFSDYGADVDLIAPGACVLSTLPTDRLGLMSGTSMATPHVSGGAALYYLEEARAGRPRPTPQQVRAALIANGTSDWQTATDPDNGRAGGAREPALDVSNLDLPQSFEIGVRRQIVRVPAGSSPRIGLWVVRLGGFDSPVTLAVDGGTLPIGANATFEGSPSAPPDSYPSVTIDIPTSAGPGAYDVSISASAADQVVSVSFRLVVYGTTPDAGGPLVALRSGVTTSNIALPVQVTWPSVANARRYELQQNVDEGGWATIAKPYGAKKGTTAWPGRRLQFRVRAKVGGIWRDWQIGPSVVVNAHEPFAAIDLAGTWLPSLVKRGYSELPVFSTEAGATATFEFTGRSVAWISMRAPSRGQATVSIDGTVVATVDLYASRKQVRRIVFSRTWSSAGSHVLRIEVLGAPSSRARVDLDALAVVAD